MILGQIKGCPIPEYVLRNNWKVDVCDWIVRHRIQDGFIFSLTLCIRNLNITTLFKMAVQFVVAAGVGNIKPRVTLEREDSNFVYEHYYYYFSVCFLYF